MRYKDSLFKTKCIWCLKQSGGIQWLFCSHFIFIFSVSTTALHILQFLDVWASSGVIACIEEVLMILNFQTLRLFFIMYYRTVEDIYVACSFNLQAQFCLFLMFCFHCSSDTSSMFTLIPEIVDRRKYLGKKKIWC
jgi:hypothetical protein